MELDPTYPLPLLFQMVRMGKVPSARSRATFGSAQDRIITLWQK